ncbi:hypothetical protein [Flavobacterium psychrotrophum]|uniref:hypothetical protein n=1 Tax=Flavobacterium psychrotrophum TaxID=2294119 RepID=UPI000E315922|nr:hypothetical protein [Flavobacterium psychrotrophum]
MNLLEPLNQHLNKYPYIYRIELLDRFFQILDNKEIVFVKPSCWTDPMENIIFNARILKGDTEYVHPAKDKIYAQCWSYDDDSYALWQIYTTKPDDFGITKRHPGIRITTHLNRLAHLAEMNTGVFNYGLVNYLPKKDLIKLPNTPEFIACLASEALCDDHFRSLLIKRKSYKYEKEVRLMYHSDENNADRIYRLKIEPHELITSLRLDPSLTKKEAALLKEQLIYQYNFKPSQITQSTLNADNKLIFRI